MTSYRFTVVYVLLVALPLTRARPILHGGDRLPTSNVKTAVRQLTPDLIPDLGWISSGESIYGTISNRDMIPIAPEEAVDEEQTFDQSVVTVKSTFSGNMKICLGVLIEPRVVLVAAQCIKSAGNLYADKILVEVKNFKRDSYSTFSGNMVGTPQEFSMEPDSNLYANIGYVVISQGASEISGSHFVSPRFDVYSNPADGISLYNQGGFSPSESAQTGGNIYGESTKLLAAEECNKRYQQLYNTVPASDKICLELSKASESCTGSSGAPVVFKYTENGLRKARVGAVESYGHMRYWCEGVGAANVTIGSTLDMATSLSFWSAWLDDMLSIYNLRGIMPPERQNTAELNQCYDGKMLKTLREVAPGQCCDACRNLLACKAWTWKRAAVKQSLQTGDCELKTNINKRIQSSLCWSGYFV